MTCGHRRSPIVTPAKALAGALLIAVCGGCPFPIAGYAVLLRPIDAATGNPLDASDVQVQLFRQGEEIGLYESYAVPLGGDDMRAWVTVADSTCGCFYCTPLPDEPLGHPPDEARITVFDGPRVGSAIVGIFPADVVIEDEFTGQITLGTVEVDFEAEP